MPEGDTVRQAAVRLSTALGGRTLTRGELRHPRLSTVDLAGRVLREARSVGKHLLIRFDRDLTLHNHLGMDGAWHVYPAGAKWRRPGHHARAVFATPENSAVGFLLQQLKLLPTGEESTVVGHLGPDLLDPDWSLAHASAALAGLRAEPGREIGLALLDQRLMAGVGNIFKTEVCFLLGVSPWTPVSDVDVERAVELSRDLLLRNVDTPLRSTTGSRQRDRLTWVYGRWRQGCLRCGGRVLRTTQGPDLLERVAYYCPACQPGPHP